MSGNGAANTLRRHRQPTSAAMHRLTMPKSNQRTNRLPLRRTTPHRSQNRRHQALRLLLRTGQFDEADKKEAAKKYSFFNWFFLAINMGALLGITVMVYIQDMKGWVWGFGVLTVAMVCSVGVLDVGVPYYRYQKPMESPFTRFL